MHFNMRRLVKVLSALIVAISLASCEKGKGRQELYPCLSNYYMVEYLDDITVISQAAGVDTLKKVNNEMFSSDGSLLLSTMRDTTFLYSAKDHRIERSIFKTKEGYETTSVIYDGRDMIASVSFFYNENYEITRIHQIERVDYLPQKQQLQCASRDKAVCFYPQMRSPKTFYAEYPSGKILLGSSSKHYAFDTLSISNGEVRKENGRFFLSINGDTIIRDRDEDGDHRLEIRKKGENEYVFSNYLERQETLGAYVYGKRGDTDTCYLSKGDSTSILLVSYTYTSDFKILKRQSLEEVIYLPKKD